MLFLILKIVVEIAEAMCTYTHIKLNNDSDLMGIKIT